MVRQILVDPFDIIFANEAPALFYIGATPLKRKCLQRPSCCPLQARHTLKKEIVQKTKGPFSVSFPCGQFKPEDLKVSLNGRVVSIEGSRSSSDDSSSFSSSFKRTFLLPKSIDLNTVYCKFNEEGVLEIGEKPRESHRQIEITVVPKEMGTVEEDKEKDEGIAEDTPILESIGPDTESDKME